MRREGVGSKAHCGGGGKAGEEERNVVVFVGGTSTKPLAQMKLRLSSGPFF